jgi:DNA polymerase-1
MLGSQADEPRKRSILQLLLERSQVEQLYSTFIKGIHARLNGGTLHCNINNTRTATARLSSSDPNLQNIPRGGSTDIKRIFVCRSSGERLLVEGDAAQLEWRVAAFLSQDPVMLDEIRQGIDMHTDVGKRLFRGKGTRTDWKIFNFRMIYGGSPYSYFMDVKMPSFSLTKWEKIVAGFYEKYSGLKEWHDRLVQEVYQNSGYYTNPTGRTFYFTLQPGKAGKEYRRPQILNYPVQSLATGDIIPLVMCQLGSDIRSKLHDALMINQVHDSIIYECNKEDVDAVAQMMLHHFRDVPNKMKSWYGIDWNCPMDGEVKVGPNWKDMIKYEEH